MAARLQKLGLFTVQDLLFHLPLRYEDRTRQCPISQLQPGMHIGTTGTIVRTELIPARKRMLLTTITDDSGQRLGLRFFNFSAAQKNTLQPGERIHCYGEVKPGRHQLEMIHPEYRLLKEEQQAQLEQALTPVYPTTEGIRQLTLRNLCRSALELLSRHPLTEFLPDNLRPHNLPLTQALQLLHHPPADTSLEQLESGHHPAQQRLVSEELLAHHLSLLQMRAKQHRHQAPVLSEQNGLTKKLLNNLPFSPTAAQQRVVREVITDISKPHPMMRLVQGDVGSGKTLVAALSALQALEHQYQVALMAPTEILAEQHAHTFSQWLEPLGIRVGWLGGKLKGKARQTLLDELAAGEIRMLVGTHAIFQEQVQFHKLALVIIDEQHRFGVHQRLALREKGAHSGLWPHQLIMTATPIPRTLAMTAYADLDCSVIDELPPGRTPVTTVAIPDTRRQQVIERVRNVCLEEKRQAYWVCTLIDESEVLECQAAENTAAELSAQLSELKVGLVHGRMSGQEKQAVMAQFKDGELDLLVATTVIEVGVDVPNSSLMIIENPERLGLAQLHQLRGRVGRGAVASHCVLLYHTPLSATAKRRLGVLRDSNDGFYIAQQDLEIRGPGELLGSRQTGVVDFKIADLVRDQGLIPEVQRLAHHLMQSAPQSASGLISRWLPIESQQFSQA